MDSLNKGVDMDIRENIIGMAKNIALNLKMVYL